MATVYVWRKPKTILPAIRQHYEEKKSVREKAKDFIEGCEIVNKEMHNYRMGYHMTGHVVWTKIIQVVNVIGMWVSKIIRNINVN